MYRDFDGRADSAGVETGERFAIDLKIRVWRSYVDYAPLPTKLRSKVISMIEAAHHIEDYPCALLGSGTFHRDFAA